MPTLRLLALVALLLPGCRNKDDTGDSGGVCTWYTDADSDGWGVGDATLGLCSDQPDAATDRLGDCDDGNGTVHPDQTEVPYDGLDNDCDAATADDDLDGDGHGVATDCADDDPTVNPDAVEVCNGVDDDCSGAADDAIGDLFYRDDDSDGFGDPATETRSCDDATGYVADATDCDDTDPGVNLAADELCDGIDNDCDRLTDDDDPGVLDATVWYGDLDADGHGDDGAAVSACEAPASHVALPGDCDDSDPAVNTDATEVCNDLDDDCDGLVDSDDDSVEGLSTWYIDTDGDGHGAPTYSLESCSQPPDFAASSDDCDDSDAATYTGANEACDGDDNDCDGAVDENASDAGTWYADADGDGHGDASSPVQSCDGGSALVADDSDCDDGDAAVSPSATEVCDGGDNDCDGLVDDDDPSVDDQDTWFTDSDGDSHGDPASAITTCTQPSGTVADDTDCDDGDGTAYPGAPELCDGDDEDCDTLVDDDDPDVVNASTWYLDYDGDGFGQTVFKVDACDAPGGYVDNALDCDDAHADASPAGSEVCDGLDNDCNGATDDDPADPGTWYSDSDGDGFGDPDTAVSDCSAPGGTVEDGADCDDGDGAVNPDADEVCDGVDNDCDGDTDGGAIDADTWYADTDGDGYGDPAGATTDCSQPSSTVANAEDCDDSDGAVNPDTVWYLDYDGDGYGDSALSAAGCTAPSSLYGPVDGDCDDTDVSFNPGATPACDGSDRDCDGAVDSDGDGDGYADGTCGGDDCDDSDAAVLPEPSGGCAVGTDCLDVLGKGYTTDTTYTIDPDGYGTGVDPEDVICDMSTSGGGWTLVATNGWGGRWSATTITDASAFGSVGTTSDYKAGAFSSVVFGDLMFLDGNGMFAAYEGVSDWSSDYQVFQDAVPANCGIGTEYEWPMSDGDFASSTLCDTALYLHVLDHDGGDCATAAHSINHGTGPAWSAVYNEGCPLDDPEGSGFTDDSFGHNPWSTAVPLTMWVR